MAPYLAAIFLYSFLIFISERAENRGLYITSKFLICISLLGISIFAGIRNLSVGIDITTYGKNIFEYIKIFGPKETMIQYHRWGDIGYIYFNYFVSFFTKSVNVYLGILELVIQISFFKFFQKFKKECSPAFGLLLLNLTVFPLTFSMLRQSLAMSIIIWMIYFLSKDKWILAILVGIFSTLFHKSSILFLGIVILVYIYTKIHEKIQEKKLMSIIIFLTLFLSVILNKFPNIVYWFIPNEGISNIQQENIGSPARFLLMLIPMVYMEIVNNEKFVENNNDYFLYFLSLIVISFSWLSGINYSITRFINYLYPIYMLFLSKQAQILNKRKIYIGLMMWGILLCWWLLARGNEGGVFPYITYWQEFNLQDFMKYRK